MSVRFNTESGGQNRHNYFNSLIPGTLFVQGTVNKGCLDLISWIILAVIIGAITIHIILRIKGKAKNNNK
jgi:hypothetical protein